MDPSEVPGNTRAMPAKYGICRSSTAVQRSRGSIFRQAASNFNNSCGSCDPNRRRSASTAVRAAATSMAFPRFDWAILPSSQTGAGVTGSTIRLGIGPNRSLMRAIWSREEVPGSKGSPVANSAIVQPRDQMSGESGEGVVVEDKEHLNRTRYDK